MTKARTTKTAPKLKAKAEGRKKSKLTAHGDEAKWSAEREYLHHTLKVMDWNLTHTATELEMGDPSAVLRAIDKYDLRGEYEKRRGWTKKPI